MARRRRAAAAASAPRQPQADRSGAWLVPLVVMTVTAATFLPALHGEFLTWDDDRNFLMNQAYRGLGPANLRWMFTTFFLGPYQPLSWMSLGLDYLLWGMDPYGYHLTNLILHVANAGLVYVFAVRLLARGGGTTLAVRLAAAVAALVFAVHPLRVESVAWVTERRDVLSGFFGLLTLVAYLALADARRRGAAGRGWLVASVTCFALSLLAKATAMALPVALIVMDVWLLRRATPALAGPTGGRSVTIGALLVEKIPFVLLAVGAAVLAAIGQRTGDVLATMQAEGPVERIARSFYGLMFYVGKTIAPVQLSNLYEVPFRQDPLDPHNVLSAAAVAGLTIVTFLWRSRWPALFVAWAGYVLLLLPVSGIAHPGGQIVADRYSYFPCLAFALLAGAGVRAAWPALAARGRGPWTFVAAGGAAAVIVVLIVLTVRQIPIWRTSLALWRHAFVMHPLERLRAAGAPEADLRASEANLARLGNVSAYWAITYNYGTALRNAGRHEEAADVFGRGAVANPASSDLRNGRAAALIDLRRYDEAVTELEAAIRIEPGNAKAQFNLGIALTALGRADDGIAAYQRAIALEPENADAHYNLGVLLADVDRLAEAEASYRRAIAIRPGHAESHNNLGVALGRQGRVREAIESFRQAVALNPNNTSAQQNLARALEAMKGGR